MLNEINTAYNGQSLPFSDSSSSTTYKRKYLPSHEYAQACDQKRAWLKAASAECKLRGNEPRVLEVLVYLTDAVTGIGEPAIGTIMEHYEANGWGTLSYSAVSANLKRIKAKGAIKITQRGSEQTNVYELIGYQYNKLETCSFDSRDNLNNLNFKDQNTKHTYDEYVSILANLEKKPDTKPKPEVTKPTKPKTHIPQSFKFTQEEVFALCFAWNLSESQATQIFQSITKNDGIKSRHAYLASLLKGYADKGWTAKPTPKPETPEERAARHHQERVRNGLVDDAPSVAPSEEERARVRALLKNAFRQQVH